MSHPDDLLEFQFGENPGPEQFKRLAAIIVEQARGGPLIECTPERTEGLIAIGLAIAYQEGGSAGIDKIEAAIIGDLP